MNIVAQLQTINSEKLLGPVRAALKSETAEVVDWQLSTGGRVGNPVSGGLYRLNGIGRDQGDLVTWSLILKLVRSPASLGMLNMGGGTNPTHWNYWKREIYAYRSGLLDLLPAGLAAPHCFGIDKQAGDIYWLWLEEVADVYHGLWSLERYVSAARHLGRFNGIYLTERSLPTYPWLSHGLLRQWCSILSDDRFPFVNLPFTQFFTERERFLDTLDRLPQTLCHRDASPTNLIARHFEDRPKETVAVDWALIGVGAIGEELGQLVLGAISDLKNIESVYISQALFEGYLDGLRDSGWHGSAQVVCLGYIVSAMMRGGLWLFWMLIQALRRGHLVDEFSKRYARSIHFILDLSAKAHEF